MTINNKYESSIALTMIVFQSLALHAGGGLSTARKKQAAAVIAGCTALAGKLSLAQAAAPAKAEIVPGKAAAAAPIEAPAQGVEDPTYTFPQQWYPCEGPQVSPAVKEGDADIEKMVLDALEVYKQAGCIEDLDEPAVCSEPSVWKVPAGPKSAKEKAKRWLTGSEKHYRDAGGHLVEAWEYTNEFENYVCYALSEFKHVKTDYRTHALTNRLLEAGYWGQLVEETMKYNPDLKKNLKLRRAKAVAAGDPVEEIDRELAEVDRAMELLQNAMGRFKEHVLPLAMDLVLKHPPIERDEPEERREPVQAKTSKSKKKHLRGA